MCVTKAFDYFLGPSPAGEEGLLLSTNLQKVGLKKNNGILGFEKFFSFFPDSLDFLREGSQSQALLRISSNPWKKGFSFMFELRPWEGAFFLAGCLGGRQSQ